MAQQTINLGTVPNDGTGDTLRDGGDKINDNFTELYGLLTSGTSWKAAVRAATTGAATLASDFENGDTIDGVTLATGDRVLIKNQASATENGIYTVNASGAPTRAVDADAGSEFVGAAVFVTEGTSNADQIWLCTTNAPITLGATNITFAQLTAGGGTISSLTGDVTGSGSGAVATTVANANYSATLTASGTPPTNAIGYLGCPQISDQDDYTFVMADAGKHHYHVSGTPHTATIPANASVAFPIGTILTFINENGGGNVTIAITSDTLRWGSSTGSRTLAANGVATATKVTSTLWRLTGNGIS